MEILINIKKFFLALYEASVNTINHDGVEHAGYLAYLSMLSFFPFLVIFFALTGEFGDTTIGNEFILLLKTGLPDQMLVAFEPRIREIMNGPPEGLLTISIVGAIWTASSQVEGVRTVLNRAYRVSTPPAYIWRRLLSIVQFIVLTIIITIIMLILVFFPSLWKQLTSHYQELAEIGEIVQNIWWLGFRYIFAGLMLFLMVAAIYYAIPNLKLSFRKIFPGAVATVTLWMGSGYLLGMYIDKYEQVNFIYGSLAGIIITLLFFFVFNLLFIFGAELNYVIYQKIFLHKD